MMTDSSSASNFITFPIIFDPFIGYKKETDSDESSKIDEEVKPEEAESLYCYEVQIKQKKVEKKTERRKK